MQPQALACVDFQRDDVPPAVQQAASDGRPTKPSF